MLTDMTIIVRVGAAMLLGALIGLERESKGAPAGLRTHILVAGAAALLVLMGDALLDTLAQQTPSFIRADPIRIVEAIVVGIGFIGAGTIWKADTEDRVRHISTAGSILFTAGIGIAMAVERYLVATVLVVIVVIVMHGLQKAEDRWL